MAHVEYAYQGNTNDIVALSRMLVAKGLGGLRKTLEIILWQGHISKLERSAV